MLDLMKGWDDLTADQQLRRIKEVNLTLLAAEALRRKLPIEREVLEHVFGPSVGYWLSLRSRVPDSTIAAGRAAADAGREGRVYVALAVGLDQQDCDEQAFANSALSPEAKSSPSKKSVTDSALVKRINRHFANDGSEARVRKLTRLEGGSYYLADGTSNKPVKLRQMALDLGLIKADESID